jgi:hypothetical protein
MLYEGPAARNQREVATHENSTSALSSTTYMATLIKQWKDRGD